MKTLSVTSASFHQITELTAEELVSIEGGNFWEDAAYLTGMTARCIYEFGKAAGEFQSSLSPSLKK